MRKPSRGQEFSRALSFSALALAALLAGCGSGGASDSTPAGPTPPAGSKLVLTGTAAVGKALADAEVSAKCSTGSQTARAQASGNFSLSIDGGKLPCLLRATSGEATLYSLASGSGDAAVVNITPITHIVVAKAMGGAPVVASSFEAGPDAVLLAATSGNVPAALTATRLALASVASYSEDPFTTPFVAAQSGGTAGDAFDKKLDDLQDALTQAQASLTQLTHAVVTSQDAGRTQAAPAVLGMITPLATAACPSIRSGEYIVASMRGSLNIDGPGAFNASAGTWTDPEGTVGQVQIDTSTCEIVLYRDGAESVRAAFNAHGVGIWRDASSTGGIDFGVIFPFQRNTLADLAGSWNMAAFNRYDTAVNPVFGIGTSVIKVDGTWTGMNCPTTAGQPSCQAMDDPPTYSVANGKFTDAHGNYGYLFKAANGTKLFVLSFEYEYGLAIGTATRTLALPAKGGALKSQNVDGNFSSSSSLYSRDFTVSDVDAVNGTYTRSDGQLRWVNKPMQGFSYRAATSSAAMVYLPIEGLLTVYGTELQDANSFVGFSLHPSTILP